MKIYYCKKCLIPNSKPGLKKFVNDICDACHFHEIKKKNKNGINWLKRKKEFEKLIKDIKKINAPLYDVLVPVSGGKDSISQVHRLLKYNLRILALNVDFGIRTKIGDYNLSLIPKMGASLITYTVDQKLQKKIVKISFENHGDPDILSHCHVHAYPIRMAMNLKIPLVLHGENPAYEYSGDEGYDEQNISQKWFDNYIAYSEFKPKIFSKKYKIDYKNLINYDLPTKKELKKIKIVFCSYFFNWNSETNLKIAKKYGFKTLKKNAEGTYRNYVGLDEKITRVHQYLKVLKFGYGRATDHACEDIRNKLISREEGKKLVLKYDRVPLSRYFWQDFINFIGISKKSFEKTLNKFKNKKIWSKENYYNMKNFSFEKNDKKT